MTKIVAYLKAVKEYFAAVDAVMTAWLTGLSDEAFGEFLRNEGSRDLNVVFSSQAHFNIFSGYGEIEIETDNNETKQLKKQLKKLNADPCSTIYGSLENTLLYSKKHEVSVYMNQETLCVAVGTNKNHLNTTFAIILRQESVYPKFTALLYQKLTNAKQLNGRIIVDDTIKIGDFIDNAPAFVFVGNVLYFKLTSYEPISLKDTVSVSTETFQQLKKNLIQDENEVRRVVSPLTVDFYQQISNAQLNEENSIKSHDLAYRVSESNLVPIKILQSLQAVMFKADQGLRRFDVKEMPTAWNYDENTIQDLVIVLSLAQHFHFNVTEMTAFAKADQALILSDEISLDDQPLMPYLKLNVWPRDNFTDVAISLDIVSILLEKDKYGNFPITPKRVLEKLNGLTKAASQQLRLLINEINMQTDAYRSALQSMPSDEAQAEVMLLQWGLEKFKRRVIANFLKLTPSEFVSTEFVYELDFLRSMLSRALSEELVASITSIRKGLFAAIETSLAKDFPWEDLTEIVSMLQDGCFSDVGVNLTEYFLISEEFKGQVEQSAQKPECEWLMVKAALKQELSREIPIATLNFQRKVVGYFAKSLNASIENIGLGIIKGVNKQHLIGMGDNNSYQDLKQFITAELNAYYKKVSPFTFYRTQKVNQLLQQVKDSNDIVSLLNCLTVMSETVAQEDFNFNSSNYGYVHTRNASGSRFQTLLSDLCYRTAAVGMIVEQYEDKNPCQLRQVNYLQALLSQLRSHLDAVIFHNEAHNSYIQQLKYLLVDGDLTLLTAQLEVLQKNHALAPLNAKQKAIFHFVESLRANLKLAMITIKEFSLKSEKKSENSGLLENGIELASGPFKSTDKPPIIPFANKLKKSVNSIVPVAAHVSTKLEETAEFVPKMRYVAYANHKNETDTSLLISTINGPAGPENVEYSRPNAGSAEWQDLLHHGTAVMERTVDFVTDSIVSLSNFFVPPSNSESSKSTSTMNLKSGVSTPLATTISIEMCGILKRSNTQNNSAAS